MRTRDWADVQVVAEQLLISGWLTGYEVNAIINAGRRERGLAVMR